MLEEANVWYDKILSDVNCKHLYPNAFYNKACFFSLKGDSANAIKYLEISVGLDEINKENAKADPDFANIKHLEEFKSIINDFK